MKNINKLLITEKLNGLITNELLKIYNAKPLTKICLLTNTRCRKEKCGIFYRRYNKCGYLTDKKLTL